MSRFFKELAYRKTPIGELSLRLRRELTLDVDIYEIKLGEEFLMSSLFTASEIALADLSLADLPGDKLDVVVGGLGLGYTADAVLKHDKVGSLIVIDMLETVIDWHREGLLPLGPRLLADPRCRFHLGNFFELAASEQGFDSEISRRRFDAILLDIDHSPEFLLAPENAAFYTQDGLAKLATHLKPDGVFGLWSNDLPDKTFTEILKTSFARAKSTTVTFHNPLQNADFTQTVYRAYK
ncbi:spermidine synthase [Alphaproteobacteria bacterium]|jgi:spermidine synthase|nr:spermidine synthase [Alphaproteobacteria bacterium]